MAPSSSLVPMKRVSGSPTAAVHGIIPARSAMGAVSFVKPAKPNMAPRRSLGAPEGDVEAGAIRGSGRIEGLRGHGGTPVDGRHARRTPGT